MRVEKDLEFINYCIDNFRELGKLSNGGYERLAYGSVEDKMHEVFRKIAEERGFSIEIDSVGNSFASYNVKEDGEYYLIGSHLDSVPNGGTYDGLMGVIAGLLILEKAKADKLDIPLKVASFRCEESSEYGRATIGSGLITGEIREDELTKLHNKNGENLYDVLKTKGYLNTEYLIKKPKEFFEIHIEQGRVLFDKGLDIGIVNSIAAPTRFNLYISGRQDHSGATPMNMRKDALTAASEAILELEKLGIRELKNSTVATVGIIRNEPNVLNVISGYVMLGIDIRGIAIDSIKSVIDDFKAFLKKLKNKRNITYVIEMISSSSPVKLNSAIVESLHEVSKKMKIPSIIMSSGAGHDAMEFARITPTALLFIPCNEGISHNPSETAKIDDLLTASRILYEYLKEVK